MRKEDLLFDKKNLRKRKIINTIMLSLCIIAAAMAVVPLIYIFFYTAGAGLTSLNFDFFTALPKPFGEDGGGMVNAIVGTVILIGLGGLFGIPIGILTGIYVSEYSGSLMSNVVKFITDVLSGIPSIVIGIFAYGLIVLPMQRFSDRKSVV